MGKKKNNKPTQLWFIKHKKMTAGVAAGLAIAVSLGWNEYDKMGKNPYTNKNLYPVKTTVTEVIDGDTVLIGNGRILRLVGIDAPNRGDNGYEEAKSKLEIEVKDKNVWLEYDRYQDDKYGRILAWIWINCETEPEFPSWNYMKLSGNISREGLSENPTGCKKGKLVQEEMVKAGMAKVEIYNDRGALKYEDRIKAGL